MTDSYNQSSINLASSVNTGNAIFISNLSELDAIAPSVGGVRTLDVPKCVIIDGEITLPDNERIVLGNRTVLLGCDADIAGLLGNVDGPLISGSGDGLVVTDIFLRNFSVGPNSACLYVTNGFNPIGRASRVERVSVGGSRGLIIEDAAAVSVNILDRCDLQGIVLRGNTVGVQLLSCVHMGDPLGSTTPTYVFFDGGDHQALRISGSVYFIGPGVTGIDASTNPPVLNLSTLWRVGNCDFIPNGGTSFLPSNLANLPGAPGVFFTGNAGISDSIFGGQIGYNGNPTSQATTIAAIGVIQPDGSVTNAVRVGTGNPANPLYVLGGASARVILDQPAGADSAVLQWAAIEAANVEVTASISLRSVDGTAKAVAGQLIYLPLGGPPQFLAAFTSVTGVLALANAGFVSVSAGLQVAPGDAVAVEIANLTAGGNQNLIVDSINLQMRSVD